MFDRHAKEVIIIIIIISLKALHIVINLEALYSSLHYNNYNKKWRKVKNIITIPTILKRFKIA